MSLELTVRNTRRVSDLLHLPYLHGNLDFRTSRGIITEIRVNFVIAVVEHN